MPIGMNDLKKIKQAVVISGLYFTFAGEMTKAWSSSIKAMSQDGI